MRTAYVSEMVEFDRLERWLTGRFSCVVSTDGGRESVRDLPLEEALEWARARARRVLVRLEDGELYSAGEDPVPGERTWPPPGMRPFVRRRPPEERWRDRGADEPPIAWHVQARLAPPGRVVPDRDEVRAVVAAVAERADADAWDSDPLDELLAGMEEARREAGNAEQFGWFSYGAIELRVHFTVTASTPAQAEADAARRLEPPAGWRVEWEATPENADSTRRSSADRSRAPKPQ